MPAPLGPLTRRDSVVSLLVGFVSGLAGGFFGVGGGLVLVPLLTGRLKLGQHQAHGTSLAVIGAMALVSLLVYGAHANVAWTTAALIALTSLIAARYGARLAVRSSTARLKLVFAILLVLVAARLLWSPPEAAIHAAIAGGPSRVAFDLGLGLVAGLLAGYLGVGGGVVIVPALTLLAGMPQHLAQGTSLAVILVAAPSGALEHARHGNVAGRLVPALAIGAALGGPLASWLAQGIERGLLTKAFAVFLLANAASYWIKARRSLGRPLERSSAAG